MFESREDGIRRLQELRKRIMFASSEDEARVILDQFEPVISLTHAELAEFNKALIKHATPSQVKKVLDEMLIKLKP